MNRRVAAVLVVTLLALCAATVWVPWRFSGGTSSLLFGGWAPTEADRCYGAGPMWSVYALQLAIVMAIGGLLALVLRTRAARGAA